MGRPPFGGTTARRSWPTEPDAPDEGTQVRRQDLRRTSSLGGAKLTALIAGMLLLLAGCAFEFGVGGDDLALSEVAASSAIDADGTATAVTSSFEVDAPVIYVAALVDGADEGARLTMTWSHETEGVFAEVPIDLLEGSSRPYSDVTRPDAGWPTGTYAVDVVATNPDDERVTRQVTFQVVAPADNLDDTDDEQAEAISDADADGARQAELVPDSEGPGFDRPEGLPAEFPLPGVDGVAFAVPDEEGLYALSLEMSVDDAVAFFDEAPGVTGWSAMMREDDQPDIDGVLYLLRGHGTTLIVVVGPDDEPGQSLVAVQLDPQL